MIMTASITALSNLLSNTVTSFAGNDNDMTLGITSNIARDALKRASDFKSPEDCIFEAIANAYEAYDMGQTPRVWLEVKRDGKETTIIIRDKGVGMCSAKGLVRFFSLHLKTERRANGLNMRGYNGTGKIAAFKYADRMQVETVKDGLRNIVVLTSSILELAARDEVQPRAQFLVKDQPTTDPNGTTITITKIKKGFNFNADMMRAIRSKVAFEQMMWMKNAEIFINDELVPAETVQFTEKWDIASPCGNFAGTIYFNEGRQYQQELPAVYMSAGRVFLAREQFGMEGRRFRANIHVEAKASEEWATEHFYDRREAFVSESRDLKLKLNNNPQAQAFADFVTGEVKTKMDMLDERENEKRRQAINATQAALEKDLSKLFSRLVMSEGGPVVKFSPEKKEGDGVENVITRSRDSEKSGGGKQKTSLINFEFADLADEVEFEIDYVAKRIKLNRQGAVLKALTLHSDTPIYQVATFEVATAAFCNLLANNQINEAFADKSPSLTDIIEMHSSISAKVRAIAATLTPTYYTNCVIGAVVTAA
jgi:anti-sigma regulatory factor (Ser/Thr protein kinase)